MLVGLLFAIETVPGDPVTLVAGLPFAGTTLIEHQARRLVAAGARQIVVVVRDAGPALRGAFGRIERRGVVLDTVAGMAEAAARVHPLARVLVLADGLVTSDAAVAPSVREAPGDTLLTVASDNASARFERIGGASAWAGIAQVDAARLGDAGRLPADYDPQSTLLRVAEAAGAAHLPLPAEAVAAGHGIEHDAAALRTREARLMAAAVGGRRGWFDRWLGAPLARFAIPRLVAAGLPTLAACAIGGAIGVAAAGALFAGWWRAGMALAVAATLAAVLATALAELRDEGGPAGIGTAMQRLIPALAVLVLGQRVGAVRTDGAPLVTAVALVVAAALAERAAAGSPARWWGGPSAYLLVAAAASLAGAPFAGLALAACYAAATLAAAIERTRQQA